MEERLRGIDPFTKPKPDPRDRTKFGGILSILSIPAALVVAALLIVQYDARPTVSSTKTVLLGTDGTVPTVSIKCNTPHANQSCAVLALTSILATAGTTSLGNAAGPYGNCLVFPETQAGVVPGPVLTFRSQETVNVKLCPGASKFALLQSVTPEDVAKVIADQQKNGGGGGGGNGGFPGGGGGGGGGPPGGGGSGGAGPGGASGGGGPGGASGGGGGGPGSGGGGPGGGTGGGGGGPGTGGGGGGPPGSDSSSADGGPMGPPGQESSSADAGPMMGGDSSTEDGFMPPPGMDSSSAEDFGGASTAEDGSTGGGGGGGPPGGGGSSADGSGGGGPGGPGGSGGGGPGGAGGSSAAGGGGGSGGGGGGGGVSSSGAAYVANVTDQRLSSNSANSAAWCSAISFDGAGTTYTVGTKTQMQFAINGQPLTLDSARKFFVTYLQTTTVDGELITGATVTPPSSIGNDDGAMPSAARALNLTIDYLCPEFGLPLTEGGITLPILIMQIAPTYVDTKETKPGTVADLLSSIGGGISFVMTVFGAIAAAYFSKYQKVSAKFHKAPTVDSLAAAPPSKLSTIDIYISPKVDENDKIAFGGFLALLVPVALILLTVYLSLSFQDRPTIVTDSRITLNNFTRPDSIPASISCEDDNQKQADGTYKPLTCAVMFTDAECMKANGGVTGIIIPAGESRQVYICTKKGVGVIGQARPTSQTSANRTEWCGYLEAMGGGNGMGGGGGPGGSGGPGGAGGGASNMTASATIGYDGVRVRVADAEVVTFSSMQAAAYDFDVTKLVNGSFVTHAAAGDVQSDAAVLIAVKGSDIANLLCPGFYKEEDDIYSLAFSLSATMNGIQPNPSVSYHEESRPGDIITLLSSIGGALNLVMTVFGGLTAAGAATLCKPKSKTVEAAKGSGEAETEPEIPTLAKIDIYVAPYPDPSDKTSFGGVMTILTPILVILAIVFLTISYLNRPVTITTQSVSLVAPRGSNGQLTATSAATTPDMYIDYYCGGEGVTEGYCAVLFPTPLCRAGNGGQRGKIWAVGKTLSVNIGAGCVRTDVLSSVTDRLRRDINATVAHWSANEFCAYGQSQSIIGGAGAPLVFGGLDYKLGSSTAQLVVDQTLKLDGTTVNDAVLATPITIESRDIAQSYNFSELAEVFCPGFFPSPPVQDDPPITWSMPNAPSGIAKTISFRATQLLPPPSFLQHKEALAGNELTLLSSIGGAVSIIMAVLGGLAGVVRGRIKAAEAEKKGASVELAAQP